MREQGAMNTMPQLLALTCLLASGSTLAQQLQQANYEEGQAQRGELLYQQNCAACHLADLSGSFEAPNLADNSFRNNWSNRGMQEFLDMLRRTMPPQAPGSLTESQYQDVSAFLLSANAIPASSTVTLTAANSVVFLNGDVSAIANGVQRTPVPGRAGTVPSPHTRNAVPEIATVYSSDRALSRSYTGINNSAIDKFRNVSSEELANPAPADWTYWRRSPNSQGYTPLDQITTENVSSLSLAWVWGMEAGRSQPAPLVRDGIIFIPNFGNVVQALDGRDGSLLWEYRRQFPEGGRSGGLLRTLAMWEDMIFVATTDAHLVALDARTGAVRWDSEIADETLGYSNTSGPIVADGVVINGITGCGRFFRTKLFHHRSRCQHG